MFSVDENVTKSLKTDDEKVEEANGDVVAVDTLDDRPESDQGADQLEIDETETDQITVIENTQKVAESETFTNLKEIENETADHIVPPMSDQPTAVATQVTEETPQKPETDLETNLPEVPSISPVTETAPVTETVPEIIPVLEIVPEKAEEVLNAVETPVPVADSDPELVVIETAPVVETEPIAEMVDAPPVAPADVTPAETEPAGDTSKTVTNDESVLQTGMDITNEAITAAQEVVSDIQETVEEPVLTEIPVLDTHTTEEVAPIVEPVVPVVEPVEQAAPVDDQPAVVANQVPAETPQTPETDLETNLPEVPSISPVTETAPVTETVPEVIPVSVIEPIVEVVPEKTEEIVNVVEAVVETPVPVAESDTELVVIEIAQVVETEPIAEPVDAPPVAPAETEPVAEEVKEALVTEPEIVREEPSDEIDTSETVTEDESVLQAGMDITNEAITAAQEVVSDIQETIEEPVVTEVHVLDTNTTEESVPVVEPDVQVVTLVEQAAPVAEVAEPVVEAVAEPTPAAVEMDQMVETKPEPVAEVIQEQISEVETMAEVVQITEPDDVPEPVEEIVPEVIQETISEKVEQVVEEVPVVPEVAIASLSAVEIADTKPLDETPAATDIPDEPATPEVPITAEVLEQVEAEITEESVTESDVTPEMVQLTEAPIVAEEITSPVEEPVPETLPESIPKPENIEIVQKPDRPVLPTPTVPAEEVKSPSIPSQTPTDEESFPFAPRNDPSRLTVTEKVQFYTFFKRWIVHTRVSKRSMCHN